jgi:hypothetical protein
MMYYELGGPRIYTYGPRDAKRLGVGRERPPGLARPFSSRRMWSVSAGF